MTGNIIWAGWIAGSLIGLYAVIQYLISNRQLGCSLAYGNFSRFIPGSQIFKTGDFSSLNNWRLWFFIGIPIGSMLAHLSSPEAVFELSFSMGQMYDQILPNNPIAKIMYLITGGIMMGYGARKAGGCTSGHVIAGCAVLNPISFVAATLFFIAGLLTVQLLFLFFT